MSNRNITIQNENTDDLRDLGSEVDASQAHELEKIKAETDHFKALRAKTELESAEIKRRLKKRWFSWESLLKTMIAGLIAAAALYAFWKGILQDIVTHAEKKAERVSELAEIQNKIATARFTELQQEKDNLEARKRQQEAQNAIINKRQNEEKNRILAQLQTAKENEAAQIQQVTAKIAELEAELSKAHSENNANKTKELDREIGELRAVNDTSLREEVALEKRALSLMSQGELDFPGTVMVGSTGDFVKRVREWLNLSGQPLQVNTEFDTYLRDAVLDFQKRNNLEQSGEVDQATFHVLTEPMRLALQPVSSNGKSYSEVVLEVAEQHLSQHPRESGGSNRGPWVRMYTNGNDGPQWSWGAGFISFVLHQASDIMDDKPPINGSVSFDILATQAKENGLLISKNEVLDNSSLVPPGSVSLLRRTSNDWTVGGIVASAIQDGVFGTIEGNTNDDGQREGYEVAARTRSMSVHNYDFIVFPDQAK